MQIASLRLAGRTVAGIRSGDDFVPLDAVNAHYKQNWPLGLQELIQNESLSKLNAWFRAEGCEALAQTPSLKRVAAGQAAFAPLYAAPPKIWGIGLNYAAHARDLDENVPIEAPASFMKPATAVIGHGETIEIPHQSHKTTAEAELGVVVGRRCRRIDPRDWLSYVAGFTPIIDMTAEDILRRNPRYLTLSKSFDTFFSFGPCLVTPDEIDALHELEVATVINDRVHARNVVSNMTFPPDRLLAFHSEVMTLVPGDIISTGTPGAVEIQDGDRVGSRISGFLPLVNRVRDLKRQH